MRKVGLFCVPRSGSTWLGEIINSCPEVKYKFQPNFAYSFEHELTDYSTQSEIETFFEKLYNTDDAFINGNLSISGQQKTYNFDKRDITTLCFKETHFLNIIENLLKSSSIKVVGLVRSPFAVINSWLNIPKEFKPEWDISQEWEKAERKNKGLKTHYFGYDKWKEASFLFLKLRAFYPNQFYLMNYDDLITDIDSQVKMLFQFLEMPYTSQTVDFITQSSLSQNDDAYSVFKQKRNDLGWQSSLPEFIQNDIKKDPDFIMLNTQFQWI